MLELGLSELSVCMAVNVILDPRNLQEAIRYITCVTKIKSYLCMRTHHFVSSPLFLSRKGLFLTNLASRIYFFVENLVNKIKGADLSYIIGIKSW